MLHKLPVVTPSLWQRKLKIRTPQINPNRNNSNLNWACCINATTTQLLVSCCEFHARTAGPESHECLPDQSPVPLGAFRASPSDYSAAIRSIATSNACVFLLLFKFEHFQTGETTPLKTIATGSPSRDTFTSIRQSPFMAILTHTHEKQWRGQEIWYTSTKRSQWSWSYGAGWQKCCIS